MTREEAREELQWMINGSAFEAMTIAIAALRGPDPDPSTGLLPCGCGGKARFGDGDKAVCGRCGIATLEQFTQEDAKNEWNRAMGWRGK